MAHASAFLASTREGRPPLATTIVEDASPMVGLPNGATFRPCACTPELAVTANTARTG